LDAVYFNGYIKGTPAETAYHKIIANISSHQNRASFLGQTYTLPRAGATYSRTITDTSGVLSGYQVVSAPSGVTASISGGNLTVMATSAVTNGKITFKRTMPAMSSQGIFALDATADQRCVVGVGDDPVTFDITINTESLGNLSIIKTTQHNSGLVDGFTFEVRNSGGTLVGTYTTTRSGVITIQKYNASPALYSRWMLLLTSGVLSV